MKTEIETAIKVLAERSSVTGVKSEDAIRLSQAALNLAHVLATLDNIKSK